MRYEAVSSVDEAVSLLAEAGEGGRVLAGGTDILVQLRAGIRSPEVMVDVKKIPQLKEITVSDDGIRIGAAVAGAELSEHDVVPNVWPGIVEAVDLIGSTQIQGRASAGGPRRVNAGRAVRKGPAAVAGRSRPPPAR